MSDDSRETTSISNKNLSKKSADIPKLEKVPRETGKPKSSADIPRFELAPGTPPKKK